MANSVVVGTTTLKKEREKEREETVLRSCRRCAAARRMKGLFINKGVGLTSRETSKIDIYVKKLYKHNNKGVTKRRVSAYPALALGTCFKSLQFLVPEMYSSK